MFPGQVYYFDMVGYYLHIQHLQNNILLFNYEKCYAAGIAVLQPPIPGYPSNTVTLVNLRPLCVFTFSSFTFTPPS